MGATAGGPATHAMAAGNAPIVMVKVVLHARHVTEQVPAENARAPVKSDARPVTGKEPVITAMGKKK